MGAVDTKKLEIRTIQLTEEIVEKWAEVQKNLSSQQAKEPWIDRLIKQAKDNEVVIENDGLIRILHSNKYVIPVPDGLAKNVIEATHELILHFGREKVYNFAKNHFIIKNEFRLVQEVTRLCTQCQEMKYYTGVTVGQQYYDYPHDTKEIISIDIIGPLPVAELGLKYLIVIRDLFSKLVRIILVTKITAATVCKQVEDKFIKKDGAPKIILTDQGRHFPSYLLKESGVKYNCEMRTTSPLSEWRWDWMAV